MTIFDWLEFVRMNWKKEEGQTMAEYGVVLAVITVLIVGVLATLSTCDPGRAAERDRRPLDQRHRHREGGSNRNELEDPRRSRVGMGSDDGGVRRRPRRHHDRRS